MKKIITIAALFALSFATGFTCSKKAPEQSAPAQETTAQPAADAAQAQMATPPAGEANAQQPAAAGQPAPTEATAPAAAPTETK